MRMHGVLVSLLAIVAVGASGAAAIGCHVESHAQVGGAQPPPTPPPPVTPPPPATVAEPPPPPPPPKRVIALKGVQMKSATQIDMPGDIEFEKASSKIVLNDKTRKVLTKLAGILKDNPEITKLSIEGNTDNEGESKGFDNIKLSEQRAQAVVDWLSKQGVDGKRLNAVGNGSKNPLAPNDTPEHMAQNRRVEFHVREFSGQATGDAKAGAPATAGAAAAAAAVTPPAAPASPPPTTPAATPAGSDAAKKPAK